MPTRKSQADVTLLDVLIDGFRRAGRAIMVRARAPWFSNWWHDKRTWEGDPMDPIFDWIAEESG